MKSNSLNGHKLVYNKGKHGPGHWLIVVLIRFVKLVTFSVIGVYLFFTGYFISQPSTRQFLPTTVIQNMKYYSQTLPLMPAINAHIFGFMGDWHQKAPTWWATVVGLPLMVIGTIIILTVVADFYYALFVPFFHQTHCPLCKEPIKIVKKR